MKLVLRVLLGLAVVWLIYFARAHFVFRFYPSVVSAMFLVFFAVSLFRTPLVELFARRMGAHPDERGVAYCRRCTVMMVGFLAVNLVVSFCTVFMSREIWVLYNGGVSYLLMGMMFLVEYLFRKLVSHG